MEFIGRKEELGVLRKLYATPNYEGILVYGRRRIGKSELIKESLKGFEGKAIYFECQKASEEFNVRGLSEVIAKSFFIPVPGFHTFEEALDFLFEQGKRQKVAVAIDEYPYVRDKDGRLDSVFQNKIDEYRMSSSLKLIVCGSYIETMEKLSEENSPLYGRFTMKLDVKQMDYLESSLFYPRASNEDKVAYYSIFGGVPYYNQFVDDSLSVKENIIDLIASPRARLLGEAEGFLNQELHKLSNANECFFAIASGHKKFNDILSQSHISSSPMLAEVLKKLCKMDVVEKVSPINDDSEKKTYYEIKERLSLFYYQYLFRRNSFFKVMPSEAFFEEFIEQDFFQRYVPLAFELIGKQYLAIKNRRGEIKPVLRKIGKYYFDDPKRKRNGEFDIVTLSKDGYDFYEAKFTEGKLSQKVVDEEKARLKGLEIPYRRLGFLSKSGFDIVDEGEYDLIGLDDVYALSQDR